MKRNREIHILSSKSSRFKKALLLHKKKERTESRLFLVEGAHAVEEAVKAGLAEEIFLDSTKVDSFIELVSFAEERGIKIHYLVSRDIARLADTRTPAGVLAVAAAPVWSMDSLCKKWEKDSRINGRRFFVLEKVNDPGNLGTIIRSCHLAGVDALLIDSTTVDPMNPKTVRATGGAFFHFPVLVYSSVSDIIDKLKEMKFKIIATTLGGGVPYSRIDWKGDLAVLFGSESHGLSEMVSERSDEKIYIPMDGSVGSLNVAQAATVIAFHSRLIREGR